MKEVDFSCDEMNAFVEKVRGYFSGIDTIIKELEDEKETLSKEKVSLESQENLTADILKRKATIGNDIKTVENALSQAQGERNKIQERYWTEISNEANSVFSVFDKRIKSQLVEIDKEIDSLLIEANKKINDIKEIENKKNSVFNTSVTHKINKVVGGKTNSPNTRVLSPNYTLFVDSLEKRFDRLKV